MRPRNTQQPSAALTVEANVTDYNYTGVEGFFLEELHSTGKWRFLLERFSAGCKGGVFLILSIPPGIIQAPGNAISHEMVAFPCDGMRPHPRLGLIFIILPGTLTTTHSLPMNKVFSGLVAALILSLAVNAWQFSQRSNESDDAPGKPSRARTGATLRNNGSTNTKPVTSNRRDHGKDNEKDATSPLSLREILAIPNPLERYEAALAFVKNLTADEIEGYLKELRAGSGKGKMMNPETNFLRNLLLAKWTQEDPDAALASLSPAGGKQAYSDAGTVLGTLAAMDPARAAAWLSDSDNAILRQPWMSDLLTQSIAEQWARQDPDAALEWASTLDPDQQVGAYSGIISNILESDPQRAAALAMSLDSADRPRLLGQIAEAWAARDAAGAVAWANTLSGADREGALSEALGTWAASEPSAAAAYVDQLPQQERSPYLLDVVRNWSQQAPADAAAWLGNQPEGEGRAGAMGHLMWNWTTADPEAAANWLGEQPAGPSYDSGVTGLAKAATHAYDDPSTAVNWASTIENQDLRESMTQHTLGVWRRQNEEAARSWAAENGVDLPSAQPRGK